MRKFHKRYAFIIENLKKFCDLTSKTLVDCGCSDGDGTRTLANAGCSRVVGMDVDKERIKLAVKESQFTGSEYVCCSITEQRLNDNFADIYICSETLEHLDKRETILAVKEIARVLKTDGLLCITVPSDKKKCLQNKKHKQYLSLSDLQSLFGSFKLLYDGFFTKTPSNKAAGNLVVIFQKC